MRVTQTRSHKHMHTSNSIPYKLHLRNISFPPLGCGSDGQLGIGVTRNVAPYAVNPSVWLKPQLIRTMMGAKVRMRESLCLCVCPCLYVCFSVCARAP